MFCSTETPQTTEVVLRFQNKTSSALRVLWVDHGGEEREYAVIEPGQGHNQCTYSTHAWRLRAVDSGLVACEYVGYMATVTVEGNGATTVRPGQLCYDCHSWQPRPEWGTYRARATAFGIPIVAWDCVSEEAVRHAAHTMECMLADVDASIIHLMCQRGAELAIIGKTQVTSDIPAHSGVKGVQCEGESRSYDNGTRGLGGNMACPTASVGEENITMDGDNWYHEESVLVHEFAHSVMDIGLNRHPLHDAIKQAYETAKAQGLYKDKDAYIMANPAEYWAEASQAWFDATVRTDVTCGVNTREKLKQQDPELAAIMTTVYGDGPWRYPLTAPRPFGPGARTQVGPQQPSAPPGPPAAAPAVAPAPRAEQHFWGGAGDGAGMAYLPLM
ncbi:hypothetical protein N2152v2_006493 [Parachlorella kessleri]